MTARGRFVTLEGGEGVGKSTQAALLAAKLRGEGLTVIVTREPGGTPGAEAVRELLVKGGHDRWSARAEALLFAAARADHVERVIAPALASGTWVICDRFVDSTRAYQGADGVADADVMALHRIGSHGLMPDRTLLLTLPGDEAAGRLTTRGTGPDRFDDKGHSYHQRLAVAFARLAVAEPERIVTVDAGGAEDEVTRRLLAALDGLR